MRSGLCRLCGWWVIVNAIATVSAVAEENDQQLGLRVQPRFEVTLFADDDLAHDIFSLTIDAQGRVVVAGAGFIKILHDDNHDGRADRATLYSDKPISGAHGMTFDGADLVCTGDRHVLRLCDTNGDDIADHSESWAELNDGEHGAHGVIRGPDGWYYIVCGNDARVGRQHARASSSPIKNPRCGAILRVSPDGKTTEVVAHGFRNIYDADFLSTGELLTVDSDNERDFQLPWYAPTRLFDVALGMEHGWVQQGWEGSWNRPDCFFDNVERVTEIGRGSPTGVLTYQHRRFPPRYRNGVFSACWTLGRIYFFPLTRRGATFVAPAEIFLESTSEFGFAPVDMAVGPSGDMYIAVGGRGTRGGVYRIKCAEAKESDTRNDDLMRVLKADQPLSSWSRAQWVPLAKNLGQEAFERAAQNANLDSATRVRAVEVLVELFEGMTNEIAACSMQSGDPEVCARIAWALGRRQHGQLSQKLLFELARHKDLLVRRSAWEALNTLQEWDANLQSLDANAADIPIADRRVRTAIQKVIAGHPNETAVAELARQSLGASSEFDQCVLSIHQRGVNPDSAIKLLQTAETDSQRLEAVRIAQLSLGDLCHKSQSGRPEVLSGYLANAPENLDDDQKHRLTQVASEIFPSGNSALDRELARLFGLLAANDPRVLAKVTSQISENSSPADDIHFLIVSALLVAERKDSITKTIAHALASLNDKLDRRGAIADRCWPLRVSECFRLLCRHDRSLCASLAADSNFRRNEHNLFVNAASGDDRLLLARRLFQCLADSGEWTTETVDAFSVLQLDELLPRLRSHWEQPELRDAIASVLAKNPRPADRSRFIESLSSLQPQVVESSSRALLQLGGAASSAEIASALRALRQACLSRTDETVRAAVVALLRQWTGQSFTTNESAHTDLTAVYRPWFEWFAVAYPNESKSLDGFSQDLSNWNSRLATVGWNQGDEQRGKALFGRLSCQRCHGQAGRIGPDLTGAAMRFSRNDLFAAIVDPGRDVAPPYRTNTVVTENGKMYTGLVIYQSPESTLLQIGADTTLRISGVERGSLKPSKTSLMPQGLLNDASDRELADLYAYLKTLTLKSGGSQK